MTVEERVWEELRKVLDPEMGVSIVEMGLIYDVRYEAGELEVEMTLTSPGCPLAGVIEERVKDAVKGIKEIKKIVVEIVWDPPWSMDMMSEELKAEYGVI